MSFRVMHACEIYPSQLEKMKYPVYVSPKLDGIHFIQRGQKLESRTLKILPNLELQIRFAIPEIRNMEGEITIGNPMAHDVFKKTHSFVMTRHAREDMIDKIGLYVFDLTDRDNLTYGQRYSLLQSLSKKFPDGIYLMEQTLVHSAKELLEFEKDALDKGAEGIMIRDPDSHYKYGDSTLSHMELVKFKRFLDGEAKILNVFPMIGHPDKAGGALVKDIKSGVEFGLGTGFSKAERIELWKRRKAVIGKIVKYKYTKISGYEKPRFPTFLGYRDPIDILDFPVNEFTEMLNQ